MERKEIRNRKNGKKIKRGNNRNRERDKKTFLQKDGRPAENKGKERKKRYVKKETKIERER